MTAAATKSGTNSVCNVEHFAMSNTLLCQNLLWQLPEYFLFIDLSKWSREVFGAFQIQDNQMVRVGGQI